LGVRNGRARPAPHTRLRSRTARRGRRRRGRLHRFPCPRWELARREHAPEAALRWGLEALEAQPEDVPLRRQVALQLTEADRPREARAQLEELLTIRRGDPKALYALAMLALRDGDADAAETWLVRTRRDPRAEAELAPLLLEPAGTPEQAHQSRTSLQSYASQHPDSRLSSAWTALGKAAER